MRYRTLGRTGLKVSEMGFGTWGMGGRWGRQDDPAAVEALRHSLELGINFFDTALAYGDGLSESLIAQATRGCGRKITVATKAPPKNQEWPARPGCPIKEAFPRDWIIRCTEKSLKNLQTDCIDLQQLHVWTPAWLHETEWIETLRDLQKQGKIRFIGVSINDHDPAGALDLVRSGWVDALQVIYNIFDQSPEDELFPLALEHRVGILARCPLDEGGLTGQLREDTPFPRDDWRHEYFRKDRLREVVERVKKMDFLLEGDSDTLAEAALRFCLSDPAVSTVIPGMRRTAHVTANCQASEKGPLQADDLRRLRSSRWVRNFYQS